MASREILVVVTNARSAAQRVAPAASLAAAVGARLTGLFASGYPVSATYGDISAWPQLVETYLAAQRGEASAAEAAFRQELARYRLTGDWIYREADAVDTVTGMAPLYDLVVLGQPDPDIEAGDARAIEPETIVLGIGRPVLIVPYAGAFAQIGQRVLVTWNASREATRALYDAMFLLERALSVTVLEIGAAAAAGAGRVAARDIAAALVQRGIPATAESGEAGDLGVHELLLSRAADLGADLLVMGAWGHSRLREYVLGGVSRGILSQMNLPVLMTH